MPNSSIALLKSVAPIARDGGVFYRAAQNEVSDPALRRAFARLAQLKRALVDALTARLGHAYGAGAAGAGTFRHHYAELLVALATRDAADVIAELEALERTLLEQWEQAIRCAASAPLRAELEALLPQVERCYDEIATLRRMRRAA